MTQSHQLLFLRKVKVTALTALHYRRFQPKRKTAPEPLRFEALDN